MRTWYQSYGEAHQRYVQQAGWSAGLLNYLCARFDGWDRIRVLDVGCGTGALTEHLPDSRFQYYGLDLDAHALRFGQMEKPVMGDGAALPFPFASFDLVMCHYLLLWCDAPVTVLREMRRVTAPRGLTVALAEPNYDRLIAAPRSLARLAEWQREALSAMGMDSGSGGKLGQWFAEAGFTGYTVAYYERGQADRSFLRDEAERMARDAGIVWTDPLPENADYYVPTAFAYAGYN